MLLMLATMVKFWYFGGFIRVGLISEINTFVRIMTPLNVALVVAGRVNYGLWQCMAGYGFNMCTAAHLRRLQDKA